MYICASYLFNIKPCAYPNAYGFFNGSLGYGYPSILSRLRNEFESRMNRNKYFHLSFHSPTFITVFVGFFYYICAIIVSILRKTI